MTVKEFYREIDGDYEDVMTRLPTDAFVMRFVKRFPSDGSYSELLDAVNKDDICASFEAAHKLKGIAANLAFSALYEASIALTEQLRPCTKKADSQLLQRVCDAYDVVARAILRLDDTQQ